MVDTDAFAVGRDLAVTAGAVVRRAPLFELIQFTPQTGEVHTTPTLIVPPTINKFYILDLAPQRSLIEYLVSQGQQVFVMSWRNPDAASATTASTPMAVPWSSPWKQCGRSAGQRR